jgi:hypothetical protein
VVLRDTDTTTTTKGFPDGVHHQATCCLMSNFEMILQIPFGDINHLSYFDARRRTRAAGLAHRMLGFCTRI